MKQIITVHHEASANMESWMETDERTAKEHILSGIGSRHKRDE